MTLEMVRADAAPSGAAYYAAYADALVAADVAIAVASALTAYDGLRQCADAVRGVYPTVPTREETTHA